MTRHITRIKKTVRKINRRMVSVNQLLENLTKMTRANPKTSFGDMTVEEQIREGNPDLINDQDKGEFIAPEIYLKDSKCEIDFWGEELDYWAGALVKIWGFGKLKYFKCHTPHFSYPVDLVEIPKTEIFLCTRFWSEIDPDYIRKAEANNG